ncbi:YjfB family protein [Clostridium estertheticum]|uniref:YjfB family protein n=1 Tax=Clostridium estertheticum TaxID=238834 RepID=A0A7Y3WSJ6_9CLOT|nr:YjfB family protein [Clostridium estertheticum]NNU76050.1 YjfB family protein [Clostridium estertheticum]WBL46367.1 YjfB family protein [Clostridium estertheticum]
MDISPISMEVSLPIVQQHTDTVVMKTATDIGKENDKQIIEKIHNEAIDPNVGQNLDVIADSQMDKKEELHKQQQQEMKWAQEKQKMLNIKEVKLLQMREIAEQGKQVAVTEQQLSNFKHRLDKLAAQVSAIDSESKRTKDGKKLE